MTLEEFKKLSEIYGAEIRLWPKPYREKLSELSVKQFKEMRQILDEEAKLDVLLVGYTIDPPSRALFERIVASAPQLQPSIWQQLSAWFNFRVASVGLATAMAGALCVSIWTSHLLPDNTDGIANSADNIDYGQDWIG